MFDSKSENRARVRVRQGLGLRCDVAELSFRQGSGLWCDVAELSYGNQSSRVQGAGFRAREAE